MGVFEVDLEPFSRRKARRQGRALGELVTKERDWLIQIFPDMVEACLDNPAKYVGHLASTKGLEAFIVLKKKGAVALGVAQIISNQQVTHPDFADKVYRGDYLDYWLEAEAPDNLHLATAQALIGASRKRVEKNKDPQAEHGYMAVIPTGHPHQPIGLTRRLEHVGVSHVLGVPPGVEDNFGITKGGAAQLYFGSTHLAHPISHKKA